MRRLAAVLASAVVGSTSVLDAQGFSSRSADYVFVSTAEDARALWVNPAGTQYGAAASLLAELVVDRSVPDDTRLSQWTAGLSTRAFSLGYQRDRLRGGGSNQAVRIGLATRFPRGAVGFSTTFHRAGGSNSRGADFGLRYALAPPVSLGAVVRNVGKPRIRGTRLPVVGAVGLGWLGAQGRFRLQADAVGTDNEGSSGIDMSYRAGANLTVGNQMPFAAILAVQLDEDFDVATWTLGISVGGDRKVIALGTVGRTDGTTDLDGLSLTGVALNRGVAARR